MELDKEDMPPIYLFIQLFTLAWTLLYSIYLFYTLSYEPILFIGSYFVAWISFPFRSPQSTE